MSEASGVKFRATALDRTFLVNLVSSLSRNLIKDTGTVRVSAELVFDYVFAVLRPSVAQLRFACYFWLVCLFQ